MYKYSPLFHVKCYNNMLSKMDCQLIFFFVIAVLAVNLSQAGNIHKQNNNIMDQLKSHGFNTLVQHLNKVHLQPLLASQGGPFTLFAPTDEAFKSLNPEIARAIDASGRWAILQHGVARQILPESSITNGMVIKSGLNANYPIKVTISNDQVAVLNQIASIIGKIEADNGVIYPIDGILIESITEVLRYFDSMRIANGTYAIFEKAVEVSGLTSMLEDPKELLTVFVPTDAAFNALGEDIIKDLLTNPEKARKLLFDQYIVSGLISSDQLVDKNYVNTIGGDRLLIQKGSGGIKVGAATVLLANRFSYNALFHIIDTVQHSSP